MGMPVRWSRLSGALAFGLLLSGGGAASSALEPRGPAAVRIADLWWLMFWLGMGVFVVTMGFLAYALFRRRRGTPRTNQAHILAAR
jgi:cytochrome c oxidase subunit 2